MGDLLTANDIMFAAILAFLITVLLHGVMQIVSMFFKPIEIEHTQREIKHIIEKCQSMFPREIVRFGGETFKRGMNVRIVTKRQKTIEGELVGINNDDIVCLITKKYVVAQDLQSIKEMKVL